MTFEEAAMSILQTITSYYSSVDVGIICATVIPNEERKVLSITVVFTENAFGKKITDRDVIDIIDFIYFLAYDTCREVDKVPFVKIEL